VDGKEHGRALRADSDDSLWINIDFLCSAWGWTTTGTFSTPCGVAPSRLAIGLASWWKKVERIVLLSPYPLPSLSRPVPGTSTRGNAVSMKTWRG